MNIVVYGNMTLQDLVLGAVLAPGDGIGACQP